MTTRTFAMAGGLVVLGGAVLLVVFQVHGCLTERRAQRAVEEAMEAEVEAIREASDRNAVFSTLYIAINEEEWTDRIRTLSRKLSASKSGNRTDRKIEAMIEAMLEVWHDSTLPIDERLDTMDKLGQKLVRAYRP